jgi:type 1 glutamine amidotransferase
VFDGVDDFRLVEEIYQFKEEPYSRENLRILLHLDPDRSDKVEGMNRKDNDYPVAWVQKVGEGRVFYTSIGHNEHIYANPLMLKHYLAGIQFAVGDLQADTTPSAQLVK